MNISKSDCFDIFNYLTQDIKDIRDKYWLKQSIAAHAHYSFRAIQHLSVEMVENYFDCWFVSIGGRKEIIL